MLNKHIYPAHIPNEASGTLHSNQQGLESQNPIEGLHCYGNGSHLGVQNVLSLWGLGLQDGCH